MHPRAGDEKALTDIDTLFKTIDPLFTTTSGLTIRPVAFPSAVMCLARIACPTVEGLIPGNFWNC